MTTQEIADQLVSLCRQGKFEEAQTALYAADARCVEAEETPMGPRVIKGLAAIIEKGRKFSSMIEQIHSMAVSVPVVADDSFACTMTLDVTMKGRGRMNINELCVYEVKAGKIILEEFHY
jgi:hypothetical protein